MEFSEVVQKRYSCKKFSEKKLSDEQLNSILNAGRLAPTAKNLQEQRIYVLSKEEHLKKIDEVCPCRYGAPTVLVVAYDTTRDFTYPGGKYKTGVEDATIVATHMILAACNEGVDSCWVNLFDPEILAKTLNLPENESVVMIMDLGFVAEGAGPLPPHNKRNDLSQSVTYL